MVYRLLLIGLYTSFCLKVHGQLTYRLDQSIPVEKDGNLLTLPWAGGLNSAEINKMDINGDGKEDLIIYERTANKVLTFLNQNNKWIYTPYYEALFPAELDQWLLLRDFNCDGRKDIFTHDNLGIAVYVNVTPPGGQLMWRQFARGNEEEPNPLLTIGLAGSTNLQTNGTDIVAIDDIDGDGDLDILDAHFDGIGSLEWHKNMSIENTGKCDSMQFVRVTQKWGNFEECNCGEYLYGTNTCAVFGGRTKHAAGKSILTIDFDNDGDRDLLFSEENCTQIYFLQNYGTRDSANFTGFTTYPAMHPVVNFQIFPAPYYEDVDFDGVPDLIVTSNTYTRSVFNIDYQNTVWFYKNTGTAALPNLVFEKTNFIQDQMIDTGDDATPVFLDEDGDGDLDMFITSYNSPRSASYVFFYENTGTKDSPHFKYVTNDYAAISENHLYNMKMQYADMNADGKSDLIFTATDSTTNVTSLYFLPNQSGSHLDIRNAAPINTGFAIDVGENILVTDVNQDGANDLLVGKSIGALQYWVHTGMAGGYNYLLENATFLGLGTSTSRQNPVAAVGDLDQDGKTDLILSDQSGTLTIYSNYRTDKPQSITNIVYDSLTQTYGSKNLGGRLWPVVVNLFNTSFPSIVSGNLLGGLQVLKNDNPEKLPENPVISILPNPATADKKFFIRSDRNINAQLFSVFGQTLSPLLSITAHSDFEVSAVGLASGIYIVRFVYDNRSFAQRVVIP